jgi:hypothetical protein
MSPMRWAKRTIKTFIPPEAAGLRPRIPETTKAARFPGPPLLEPQTVFQQPASVHTFQRNISNQVPPHAFSARRKFAISRR